MFRWSVTFQAANMEKQTVACEDVSKREAFTKVAELKRFPDITSIRATVRRDSVYGGDITWTRNKKSAEWREVVHL